MNADASSAATTDEEIAGHATKRRATGSASRPWRRSAAVAQITIPAVYLLVAYVSMPRLWKVYAHRHPELDDTLGITVTGDNHPGDPVNVASIASDDQFVADMQATGWYPAAALGLKSDLRIAVDTVIERPLGQAPVSPLFLFGRKEGLAFEYPIGDDPRSRHYVRFWLSSVR